DTGLAELDAGRAALALEAATEPAVRTVGSARGDGVGDVVLVGEAHLASPRHLHGRGLELEGLDGHALLGARGRVEHHDQAERQRGSRRPLLPPLPAFHRRLLGGSLATHGDLRRRRSDGLGRVTRRAERRGGTTWTYYLRAAVPFGLPTGKETGLCGEGSGIEGLEGGFLGSGG